MSRKIELSDFMVTGNSAYPEECWYCTIPRIPDGCIYFCRNFRRGLFRKGGHVPGLPIKSCRELTEDYSRWYREANNEK